MTTVISIENLSKVYRLGLIGSGTLRDDLHRWWTMSVRGKPDPLMTIGSVDHGNRDGDRIWALRDVDLTVRKGDLLGIVGRNGAGKSTLLKILSRVTGPTGGIVRIQGTLASMLEAGSGFQPELTGRDNVFLQGSVLGLAREQVEERYDKIVAFAEIERFMDTPVKRYSSGMFVRLAFSISAHLGADIMVVDEILGVGDVGFQKKCIEQMKTIADTGRTILFVSHRMDHINALCSRAILLDRGRKIADGPTKDVTRKYYELFEAEERKALGRREDRKGRGRVRFTDAWIENSNGHRITRLKAGQEAKFVLCLENRLDTPVHNLYVTIAIFSIENMFVGSMSTRECRLPPLTIKDTLRVELIAQAMPMNSGNFYFNCNVQTSLGGYEYDDLIDNAGGFVVEPRSSHTSDLLGAFVDLPYTAQVSSD
jgi:lipopolysaccharide transport system ATP-binding protein